MSIELSPLAVNTLNDFAYFGVGELGLKLPEPGTDSGAMTIEVVQESEKTYGVISVGVGTPLYVVEFVKSICGQVLLGTALHDRVALAAEERGRQRIDAAQALIAKLTRPIKED